MLLALAQGTGTAEDVMKALKTKGVEAKFPLFKKIHEIAFEGAEPKSLLDVGNSTKYY